jgi:serine/threonine protein kinase
VLHSEQAEDESRLERFRRGALKIKGLQHPSLIRVLDGPAEENGFHYFVMEFLAGGDLHNAILKQRITTAEALRIIIQSGRALEYVHSQGLIHRDVKPQNILLDVRNNPRLTDFDLVLAADSTGGTRTGGMGTYLYAAPEEMNDASRVDGRADVYSLGMTALFVINKQPITQVNLLRRDSFIDQLDCSMSIRQALHLATAIDASDRQPTVAAFCDSLEKAIASPNQVNFLDSSQPFVSSTLPQQVLINASSRAADNLVQPQPALGHVVSEERNITASVILDEHASPKKPAYWYRRTTILAIGFVLLISVLVLVQKAVRIWISPSTPSKFPADACIGNDKCKEFYNNGMVAYKAELYDKALSDFQHAYEIKQLPIMLVNIGRVLQKLGRPKEALDYYQRFERAEPKAHPETKKRVDEYIAQVRALIGPN